MKVQRRHPHLRGLMAKRSKKRKPIRDAASTKIAQAGLDLPRRNNPSVASLSSDWKSILRAVAIALAALWVFWPVRHGQWIGDDALYLTSNPLLHDPARVWKAWFQPGSFIEYYPIEQSVQWAQWQLWHNDSFGYHLTNIVLHVVNALLVWRLFSKFDLRLAWLGGLIFAVHPMMVDSVALVNEFKTVLSMPPFLLAMYFYIDYEQRGRRRDYWLAVGFFAVAMLCKITMAMFPVVILLYAWWKRGRIGWRDLVASAPFFAISLALGVTTAWAGHYYEHQHGTSPDSNNWGGPLFRLALVGQIISFYFSRCFLPVTPLPMYPQWAVNPSAPLQFLPWLIMAGTFCYLWTNRRTWGRHALLGLGFFLIMLAPFWGAKWISYMLATWVLDHLLYIPILGLIGLMIAGLEQAFQQLPPPCRPYGIGVVAAGITLMAFQSRAYAGKYMDEETVCAYTITHYPGNWKAHNNLGLALVQKGQLNEAIAQYEQALAIHPTLSSLHGNLGNAFLKQGKITEAISEYQTALDLNPNSDLAHYNLGNAFYQKGQAEDAVTHYKKALEINPDLSVVRGNLGNAYLKAGQVDEAVAQFQKAVEMDPSDFKTDNNLGAILLQLGRSAEAIGYLQKALEIHPNYDQGHYNLGNALSQKGRLSEAIDHYRKAVEINPNFAEAHNNLGGALLQTGQTTEAIAQFQEALRLKSDFAAAQDNLAKALGVLRQNTSQK